MSVVIMLLVIAALSIASSTKEQRDEATERWRPVGHWAGAFTAVLMLTWYIRG